MTEPKDTKRPNAGGVGRPALTVVNGSGEAVDYQAIAEESVLNEVLSALDAPEGYAIPAPYAVSVEKGIEVLPTGRGVPKRITNEPVLITARFVNESNGEEALELTWLHDGKQRRRVESKGVLRSNRKIVDHLAAFGFPVNTGNAAVVVGYLVALEAANIAVLPFRKLTNQIGWVGEDHDDFLYERRPDIEYQANSSEQEAIFRAFKTAGTAETWREVTAALEPFPRAALGIYASLGSTLLSVFDVDPFTLDIAGPSSTGKSTVMHLGASVWGYPEGLESSWNTTLVAIEQKLAMLNGLPCFLDESQVVKDDRVIQDALYLLAEGFGRSRGAKSGGLAATQRWSAIAISTGEQQLIAWTEAGGTVARTISLWGPPFGTTPQPDLVAYLRASARENYGHAGRQFVTALMAEREMWSEWQATFEDVVRGLVAKVSDPIAQRRARYLALLRTAAGLAYRFGVVTWKPTQAFWEALLLETVSEEDDKASKALVHVWSWAASNTEKFWTKDRGYATEPSAGWAGRWSGKETEEWFAFRPAALKTVLKAGGYSPEAVVKVWADRGWLLKDKSGRASRVIKIKGKPDRCVVVKISAVLALVETP